jgi:hypothetical protein
MSGKMKGKNFGMKNKVNICDECGRHQPDKVN